MKLQNLLNDHQMYHSEFQQDYLITVRAGGTTYGQYKQALRELFKRYRGLKELYTEKQLLQVDIDELEIPVENEFEQRRNIIKRTQKIMSMEDLDRNIVETEREFKRFYQQAVALKEVIGELTDEKRRVLDEEMWIFKMKEMIAIDYVSKGGLSNVTFEMVAAAPWRIKQKVMNEASDKTKLIAWYEQHNTQLPELKELNVDIRLLLE